MNNKNEALEAFESIAKEMGIAAEKAYDIILQQAFFSGMISLLWMVIGIILATLSAFFFYKVLKAYISKDHDSPFYDSYNHMQSVLGFITLMLSIVFFIAGVIVVFSNVQNMVIALFNPDYWAIRRIMWMISGH